jgi:tRNA uridine 5-carbamoylmethylation protein Kti12
MKPTLVVMMGPAGTGKSFLAEEIKKSHEDTIIVSRDKIRFALLRPEDDYFAVEPEVIRQYYYNINFGLHSQRHAYVIADATHLSKRSRKQFFRNVKTDNVRVVGIWVEVPLDVALKQNRQRTGRACVPEKVIKQMYKSKLTPQDDEPFDEIIYVNPHEDIALGRVSTGITSIKEKLHLI